MSNCYTHTCFVLHLTPAEADLLSEAVGLEKFLNEYPEADDIAQYWNGLSETFRTLFAPTGEEVVSGFIAIFPDADFPACDTSFSFEERDDGTVGVFAHADQFQPEAVANLLHRIVTTSLPVTATWSYDSDRHRPDAFGGGGFRIDAAGIHWMDTGMVESSTLFAPKYVLTMRDDEEGLLFWNDKDGFGQLEYARVYTDDEAKSADVVIADDEPEWLELPKALLG